MNNFKAVLWDPSRTPFPQGDVLSASASVQKDAQDFMAAALACNADTTVTAVPSLNVQNCGGNYVINTCVNDAGAYVSEYHRSDWLREVMRSTAEGHARAAVADTARIERADLYYDDFHTSDGYTTANTVRAIVDAVASVAPVGAGAAPFEATFADMDVTRAWPPPPPSSSPSSPAPAPAAGPARPMPTYSLYTARLSFERAVGACAARGLRLARITSREEQLRARSLVLPEAALIVRNSWLQRAVWFGATDAGDEGRWRWVDADGLEAEEVGSRGWAGAWGGGAAGMEPNGGSIAVPADEDCAVLTDLFDWAWADYPCDVEAAYLCEAEGTPPVPPPPPSPSPPPPPGYELVDSGLSAAQRREYAALGALSSAEPRCSSRWPERCEPDDSGLGCACAFEPSLFVVIAGAVLAGVALAALGIRQVRARARGKPGRGAEAGDVTLVPIDDALGRR